MNEEVKVDKNKKLSKDMKLFVIIASFAALCIIALLVYVLMPKPIAKINGEEISNDEFRVFYTQMKNYFYETYGYGSSDLEEFFNQQTEQGSYFDIVKENALNQTVHNKVLEMLAREEGFELAEDVVQEKLDEFLDTLELTATSYDMSNNEYAKEYFGLSINKLKKVYKDMIYVQSFYDKKIEEQEVIEEDLNEYYEQNRATFDSAVVSHILIKCAEDADEAEIQEKKAKAEDILNRVNSGENFASLASEFSEDDYSKDKGGTYSIAQDGQMLPEFEEWAFSHNAGDTGIIETDLGFHVMSLDSIINTLEQSREYIEYSYKASKYQAEVTEIMQDKKYEPQILAGYENFTD